MRWINAGNLHNLCWKPKLWQFPTVLGQFQIPFSSCFRRLVNLFNRTLAALAIIDNVFIVCDLLDSFRRFGPESTSNAVLGSALLETSWAQWAGTDKILSLGNFQTVVQLISVFVGLSISCTTTWKLTNFLQSLVLNFLKFSYNLRALCSTHIYATPYVLRPIQV